MKTFSIDFSAVKQADGSPVLFGKETRDPDWPPQGRLFSGWLELIQLMSGILGRPISDLNVLRTSTLREQFVTAEQLHQLRLPNFNMASEFPSYQGVDFSPDDDPDED